VTALLGESTAPEVFMPFLEGLPHKHLALVAAYLAAEVAWGGGVIGEAEPSDRRPHLALVVDPEAAS
jgi:hypothetical protein